MDDLTSMVGALLRLPDRVRASKAALGTATLKERQRTIAALRKEHGGPHADCEHCDRLWMLEWELRPRPTRRPPHGLLAALRLLSAHWPEPIKAGADRIDGSPDPFFAWAADIISRAHRPTTPEALRMVWRRNLPSK
jgi:hypothetical protein